MRILLVIAFLLACSAAAARADLEQEYRGGIKPLLAKHRGACHGAKKAEAELDLERVDFKTAVPNPALWMKVSEMLATGQMPPVDAPQPTPAEIAQLKAWLKTLLRAEALRHAGDPGPTAVRRLTNAEYRYTIQDLTGVPLDPTGEFPDDGAAGEGFTNAAGGLAMSPALLTRYLDAAKKVAGHAALLPDGLRWSAGTTRNDWTNETVDRIRALYNRHAPTQGATKVNLQGVVFDTNDGGRLPILETLQALLAERDAFRAGAKSPAQVAAERQVNAKYLAGLWTLLERGEPSPVLDRLRVLWRTAKPGDDPKLAREIAGWQQALVRFQNVGHMRPWMAPINPWPRRCRCG